MDEETIIVTAAQSAAIEKLIAVSKRVLRLLDDSPLANSETAEELRAALLAVGALEGEDPR